MFFFFFSSRRRHTRYWRDWSSDVCSSDLLAGRDAVWRAFLAPPPKPPRDDGHQLAASPASRSEERRVGKECRSRWSPYHYKKKKKEHGQIPLVRDRTRVKNRHHMMNAGPEILRLCPCYPFFFFQAEDGIRDIGVTGVQTCALPIWPPRRPTKRRPPPHPLPKRRWSSPTCRPRVARSEERRVGKECRSRWSPYH